MSSIKKSRGALGQHKSKLISPENVIVVHPGSLNLYIGRSSDPTPLAIPNCISRKFKEGCITNSDAIVDDHEIDSKTFSSGEEHILKMLTNMKYSDKSGGKNKNAEIVTEITEIVEEAEFYVGDDALKASLYSSYELHFPFCCGRLNDRKRSLTCALGDFRQILSTVLTINIGLTSYTGCRIILLIPDLFVRAHVSRLVDMFLNEMGFEAIFVQQESVLATLSAGLTRACVVDVGHTKTSVCCVEEGFIYPKTRLTLQYGGKTISEVFRHVLKDAGLPVLRDLSVERLKAKYCTMSYSTKGRGLAGKTVEFSIEDAETSDHSLFIENFKLVLPVLTLFSSEMMKFLPKVAEIAPDVEEQYDDYLTCRPRRSKKAASQPKNEEYMADSSDGGNAGGYSDASDDVKFYGKVDNLTGGKMQDFPSLAKAIVYSLDRCESDDMKARMLTSVLLVGGGLKYKAAPKFLQQAIRASLPRNVQENCEISVSSRPKNLDDDIVCWKGASIMAHLESLHEMWISRAVWKKQGTMSIREKAAFSW